MNLRKIVISLLYFPFLIFNGFLRFFRIEGTKIRILLMHDIPIDKYEDFKSIILSISKRWNFISALELENYLSGKHKLKGRHVLLTFDDGFHSNRLIADEILDPLEIKALFFVIGQFVDLKNHEDQQKFIKNNLYPKWRGHDYPENLKEMKNMDIEDLKHLVRQGHCIGFHSTSHENLASLAEKSELKKEIIEGALKLERELGQKINHFSFGFGNIDYFSKEALEIAQRQFNYIHTGMRGDNSEDTPVWALRRDTISLSDSNIEISSFLEGTADRRYTKKLKRYESWLKDAI